MVRHINADGMPTYTNRLANAASPYLLQHAHNPVDWFPWGAEALAEARSQDKPVLLSVGYAACHWCHVMEHESFEDEETAALMNERFVNIKVDREERPDIDSIYMTAVQTMTGSGGWPMTVFLTPDGMPFYGGTYFPPEDRYGMPSFRRVLLSVAEAYRTRRAELLQAGRELVERMREASDVRLSDQAITPETLDEAFTVLRGQFDPTYGGFGSAPKFPQAMTLEFLLRYAQRSGQRLATEMAEKTLRSMAEGGMYDQLGGGFHRYSVDAHWLVPHFEKMLYDNALLARTYLEAFQLTGEPFYRRIVEETLDYLVREMRDPAGGFYSTQDADSLPHAGAEHKEEGAFFVWTLAELREALGADAMAFAQLYDVSERGNFEGKNILHILRAREEVARVLGLSVAQIDQLVERSRARLLAARARRPPPATDDKILTSWNGMAIRAFAAAARALGRDDYRQVASDAATFVLRELRGPDGTLLRAWKSGVAGHTPGFLEDHALLADGLVALYEATFEERWLLEARRLAETIVERFWDAGVGGFYDTATQHETLVVRPRDTGDNATPSGSSVAADVLARLALIFGSDADRARAEQVLAGMAPLMQRYPSGFGRYLSVAEFLLGAPLEIVVVGDPDAADTSALLTTIFEAFLPNKVVVLRRPRAPEPFSSPLLHNREQVGGQATVYVCRGYVCRLPVTSPESLRAELGLAS
jgi:uncharacterized protein YyaL (SSP411 family)